MGGKNDQPTIGFWYYLDILLTLCHGGENRTMEIHEIQCGGRTAWSGLANTSKTISIYKKELFGGEKKEGGIEGNVDIMMGLQNQPVNPYYGASVRRSGITGPIPAYRGLLNLFFRGSTTNPEFPAVSEWSVVGAETRPPEVISGPGWLTTPPPRAFRWSAMNPYFKTVKVLTAGYYNGWYPAKNKIGFDTNPAHIIYESFTNSNWGMGYPASDLYDSKMRAVADVMFTEGFGLSLEWSEQVSIEDFMKLVLLHINAVLTQDRSTGSIYLKLIRNDYVVADLIELNPNNSKLISFDRPGTGETVNEVTVIYMGADGEPAPITVQDLASIASQGQIINQTLELTGITNSTLAARVAQRELESHSKPISKIQIESDRTAAQLQEGDVFKLRWPNQNIVMAIYRVGQIDLGNLGDSKITIDAVEDVFGLPLTSYSTAQPTAWVEPTKVAAVSPNIQLLETPYYDIARQLDAAQLDELDSTDCALDVYAREPSSDAYDYNLYTAADPQTPIFRVTASHTPSAKLTAPLIVEEFSVFTVDSLNEVMNVQQISGAYIYCENEVMRLDNINFTTNQVTVARGVLDTVPHAHATNSIVWFTYNAIGRDLIGYLPSEVAKVKVQTRTPQGSLAITSVPSESYTFFGRQNLPYPPGKFRLNGLYRPSSISGSLVVSWNNRNRLTQTADILAQDYGSLAPESSSRSVIEVAMEGATTMEYRTEATSFVVGLNGNSSSLLDAASNRDMRAGGFGELSTSLSLSLNPSPGLVPVGFSKVNGGFLSDYFFVNETTAVKSSVSLFWGNFANESRPKLPQWDTKMGIMEWYDVFGAWSKLAALLPPAPYVGPQTFWWNSEENSGYIRTISSPAYIHKLQPLTQLPEYVRDRRVNPVNVVSKFEGSEFFQFTVLTYDDIKLMSRHKLAFAVAQLTDIIAQNSVTTKKDVLDACFTNFNEFDNPVGKLPYADYPGAVTNFTFKRSELDIIIGDILYLYYGQPSGATASTSGKGADITTVLNNHFTYYYSSAAVVTTKRFRISNAGVITDLDSRSGVYFADLLDTAGGLGFEVLESTRQVKSINLITGLPVATLGVLPITPKCVYGDPVNKFIYVLDINYLLSKYDETLLLLASVQFPASSLFQTIEESLDFIYVTGKNNALDSSIIWRTDKNLTEAKPISGYQKFGTYFSQRDSSIICATRQVPRGTPRSGKGLATEDGIASSEFNQPTNRASDTITVKLWTERDSVRSLDEHSHTVKRQGWGLRWGESWGG